MSNETRLGKVRLDNALVSRGLTSTRSQADNFINLGFVMVDGKVIKKSGFMVRPTSRIKITKKDRYVSRAGYKLASVARGFNLDFRDKIVLDVGSSTGGFTDYALQHGAKLVYAVDVGKDQLHSSLMGDKRISLHEQTDIRDFKPEKKLDIIMIDVSFISQREILPHLHLVSSSETLIVSMCKPQFESGSEYKHKGVIKNNKMRREILVKFEEYLKDKFALIKKMDSTVSGYSGNLERFYLLKKKR